MIKSKIKNRILIIFTTISFTLSTVYGQQGEYCIDDFLWSSCYTFLPQNKFKYEELMCVAQVIGQGSYEIVNDTIKFHYEPIEFFSKQFQIRKVNMSSNVLKLNVLDYEIKSSIDTIYISYGSKRFEQVANQHSIELSDIQKDEYPIVVEIFSTDYSSYIFEIPEQGNYEAILFLMKGVKRDHYEAKHGSESFRLIGEIGQNLVLKNDLYLTQMVFNKSSKTLPNKR